MNARLQIVSPYARTSTVNLWGFDMACEYEYEAGEPAIWSPIDRAHPGCPANAALIACRVGGVDISEMLTTCQRERIEEALIEACEGLERAGQEEAAWRRNEDNELARQEMSNEDK